MSWIAAAQRRADQALVEATCIAGVHLQLLHGAETVVVVPEESLSPVAFMPRQATDSTGARSRDVGGAGDDLQEAIEHVGQRGEAPPTCSRTPPPYRASACR